MLWLVFTDPPWREPVLRRPGRDRRPDGRQVARPMAEHVADPAWKCLVRRLQQASPSSPSRGSGTTWRTREHAQALAPPRARAAAFTYRQLASDPGRAPAGGVRAGGRRDGRRPGGVAGWSRGRSADRRIRSQRSERIGQAEGGAVELRTMSSVASSTWWDRASRPPRDAAPSAARRAPISAGAGAPSSAVATRTGRPGCRRTRRRRGPPGSQPAGPGRLDHPGGGLVAGREHRRRRLGQIEYGRAPADAVLVRNWPVRR